LAFTIALVPYSSIPVIKNKKLRWGTWVAGFPRWYVRQSQIGEYEALAKIYITNPNIYTSKLLNLINSVPVPISATVFFQDLGDASESPLIL